MRSVEQIEKEASSRSINKTVSELVRLAKGKRIPPAKNLRKKLHDMLYRLLREKAQFGIRGDSSVGIRRRAKSQATFPLSSAVP